MIGCRSLSELHPSVLKPPALPPVERLGSLKFEAPIWILTAHPLPPTRDGRLVVCRFGADAVQSVNRSLGDVLGRVVNANRAATLAPRITEVVGVQDLEAEAMHLILVRRLDYRPRGASAVGDVVVFSEPSYAAFRTEKLQLATLAYYREQKGLKPGIRDGREGTLTKDSIRWAKTVVPAGLVTSSSVSFVSSRERWVYCGSHYQTDQELRRLKEHFAERYGYTAAAGIRDPDGFATWLGIDFALTLNKTTDVRLGKLDEIGYARSRHHTTSLLPGSGQIDTIVNVYHGPVHYEDSSGSIATQEDWFDPHGGPRAWFTKDTCFERQREYRFAVSTPGDPVRPRHYIDVSPELREFALAL